MRLDSIGDAMYDLDKLRSVAKRFRSRVKGYKSLIQANESIAAPATDPRVQKLQKKMMKIHADSVVAEAEASGHRANPQETIRQLGQERIIGDSDLMPMHFMEVAISLARGVCKVQVGRRSVGTGILVGPNLLMTNNHVIKNAAQAGSARAIFDYQLNSDGQPLPIRTFKTAPEHFFMTSPDTELDFTIVALKRQSIKHVPLSIYPWTKLISTPGKSQDGDPLNIIQHPRGQFKQLAIRNNELISVPSGKPDFLYYTTDTEPGSSGSPCFNAEWQMVALHHRAVPRIDGERVLKTSGDEWVKGVDDPSSIDWIANEGTRISAIVDYLQSTPLSNRMERRREEMLTMEPPNPVELAGAAANQAKQQSDAADVDQAETREEHEPVDKTVVSHAPTPMGQTTMGQTTMSQATMGHGAVTFQVPLSFTVSLGDPSQAAMPAQNILPTQSSVHTTATGDVDPNDISSDSPQTDTKPARRVTEVEFLETDSDDDWKNRKGYLEDFLGFKLPLPVLSDEQVASTVKVPDGFQRDGNPFALDYHNYSVAMNSERCLAWYSAAVIDGDRRFDMPNRHDKWNLDPRIDPDKNNVQFQCGEELYAAKKTDRGHLTRYLDTAWGDTKEQAIKAAKDTFFFTNCALQIQGFNRSQNRWQGIERFLLEKKAKAEKRRIAVFTGPIYSEKDPYYTNDAMDYEILTPMAFWKLCAIVRPDNTVSVTAFVLRQDEAKNLPGMNEALTITSELQITVADLEKRTGMTFPVFRDHDHLASGGKLGTLEVATTEFGNVAQNRLRSLDDIMV